jgi:hypothetical protein
MILKRVQDDVTNTKEKLPFLNQRTMKPGYVYILSNKGRTTFYIGVTSNLCRRLDVSALFQWVILSPFFAKMHKLT